MTQDIEWAEPPEAGKGNPGVWVTRLQPLVTNPGRWARIHEADSPELAQSTADNLRRRKVRIPNPEGEWQFISRDYEVFARYYPGKKAKNANVRRTKRSR